MSFIKRLKTKLKVWMFRRLLEDMDEISYTLSHVYGFPGEAYKIKKIINSLEEEINDIPSSREKPDHISLGKGDKNV